MNTTSLRVDGVLAGLLVGAAVGLTAVFVFLHAPPALPGEAEPMWPVGTYPDAHHNFAFLDAPLQVDDRMVVDVQPPADPSGAYTPTPEDVVGASATMTVDDDGQMIGAARWEQPQVSYRVGGDAATPRAAGDVDATMRWLGEVIGVAFVPVADDADITVNLSVGALPRTYVYADRAEVRIQRVFAQWDPTHPHASRWHYEEILHTVGPLGDYAGSEHSVHHAVSQDAAAATAHDVWLLRSFYAAPSLPTLTGDLSEVFAGG